MFSITTILTTRKVFACYPCKSFERIFSRLAPLCLQKALCKHDKMNKCIQTIISIYLQWCRMTFKNKVFAHLGQITFPFLIGWKWSTHSPHTFFCFMMWSLVLFQTLTKQHSLKRLDCLLFFARESRKEIAYHNRLLFIIYRLSIYWF